MAIEQPVETMIGAAVLAIAIGFGVYASSDGGAAPASAEYELTALFGSASGVTPGVDVRVAGVKVGRVTALALDPETLKAAVTLSIDGDVQLTDDTIAKIDSEGLLGGVYVSLEPGAGFDTLQPGDEIVNTQGAVSLTDLIARFATGGE